MIGDKIWQLSDTNMIRNASGDWLQTEDNDFSLEFM